MIELQAGMPLRAGKFELYQLRCFVAVAEELNFRHAAERLNMTQPPLSRQIRLLEETLGLTLLERSNRVVRLTPAGESLFHGAIDLLQRAEHAVLRARQAERGEAGAIEMGFVPSAALEFVPRIVAALTQALPDVTFRPSEMMSYEIVEALRSGRLDLGLTRMAGHVAQIDAVHVVSDGFVLALPGDHRLARAGMPTLADIDGEAFIAYSADRGGFLREIQFRIFAVAGIAPRFVQEVSQTHSVLALVNRGIGLGLVPASSRAMHMDNLAFREIGVPAEFTSDLYLAFGPRGRSALHRRVREVIVGALAEFAPAPGARPVR